MRSTMLTAALGLLLAACPQPAVAPPEDAGQSDAATAAGGDVADSGFSTDAGAAPWDTDGGSYPDEWIVPSCDDTPGEWIATSGPDWAMVPSVSILGPNKVFVSGMFPQISEDSGASWKTLTPWPSAITGTGAFGALAADGSALYVAATSKPLLRSTDEGRTWRRFRLPFDGATKVRQILTTHAPGGVVIATDGALWVSDDQLATVQRASGAAAYEQVEALVRHPTKTGHLFAAAHSGWVHRSVDGGRTWTNLGPPGWGASAVYDLAVSTTGPERILITTGPEVWTSLDGGATWTRLMNAPRTYAVAIDSSSADVLYAIDDQPITQGGARVYKSQDGGHTWAPLPVPDGETEWFFAFARRIVSDPWMPGRLYVAVGQNGLLRSDDSGATWTSFDMVQPGSAPVVARGTSTTLYSGGNALFRMDPQVGVWERMDGSPQGRTVLVDPTNEDVLYVERSVSLDRGVTWQLLDRFPRAIDSTGTIYANGEYGYLARSTTRGATWQQLKVPMRPVSALINQIIAVAVHPKSDERVYVGDWMGTYRTENGGMTWTEVDEGLVYEEARTHWHDYSYVERFAMNPHDSANIYAWTLRGPYVTSNAGESWTPTATLFGQAVTSVTFDPLNPEVRWIGTPERGVLRRNPDASWCRVGTRPLELYVRGVTLDPTRPGRLFANTAAGMFTFEPSP